jgi:CheY-like chemotaxis protein
LRTQIDAQKLARATAEKALRAKDDFLSTLSHEMRSPLNAVLGWARILRTREGVDRVLLDRALEVIERNAAAQARMIDDMLDMSRIVAGKLRIEMQPVDLAEVITAAIDVVMPAATVKHLTIQTEIDPHALPVMGDPDRLQQVVWNLLSNASKFTPAGGTITVRLDGNKSRTRITVSDTGQGISPEFMPHVFERFRQNDASSTRRQGGLGLGLALVRELVDLHGGVVRAASAGLNQGSTFTIDLPTSVSEEVLAIESDGIRARTGRSASLGGVRVLVVDDESDARELMIAALTQAGAEVTAVASSLDAVAAIESAAPDLLPHVIVSDIGMPGEDGYSLMRQVRALQPARGGRIPAITVTSYASHEDVAKAMAAGYQRHVSKPMDPSTLVVVVAQLAHTG